MNLVAILRSPEAALPRPVRSNDFRGALRQTVDAYLGRLAGITSNDNASQQIIGHLNDARALADGLLVTLDASLDGQASRARRALEDALTPVQPYLQGLVSVPITPANLGVLYRMRTAPSFPGLTRKEMFHIPFEQRDIVRPQRFSVLGLPMLYLGNTLYVCWEELGRPPLNEAWISALRLRDGQHLRVLDFAYRPGLMADLLEGAGTPAQATAISNLVAAHSMIWPLIAACTFPARERKSPFVVEYVIPQLLMAWLAESEYQGIRYFSTHVPWPPSASSASINFALPARPSTPTGHSRILTQLFEGTDAVAWPFLGATGAAAMPIYHGRLANAALSVGTGHVAPYSTTDFAKMESYLERMTFGPVV